MILLGFKNDWMDDLTNVSGYINVLHHGFDVHLAVGILRLQDGCDYSDFFGGEEQIIITTADGDEVETENEKDNKNKEKADVDSDDIEQGELTILNKTENPFSP